VAVDNVLDRLELKFIYHHLIHFVFFGLYDTRSIPVIADPCNWRRPTAPDAPRTNGHKVQPLHSFINAGLVTHFASLFRVLMGKLPRNNFSYIPFASVAINDSFWSKRIQATQQNTLPAILSQLKSTGRWDVFRLVWKAGDPNPPHIFWDSYLASMTALTLAIQRNFSRQRVTPL
jgi:hypothetical protein